MQLAGAIQRPIEANVGGIRPRTYGLVLHIQVGTGSLFNYFNTPGRDVSSHFWVGFDGRIEQYIDTDRIAWTQADGNSSWLSVETEGVDDSPLTEAQLNAVALILAQTSQRYGFPLQVTDSVNGRGLGHHAMGGVAWGNHPCPLPQRIAQKQEIVRRAQVMANGGAVPAASIQEDDMYDQAARDELIGRIDNSVIQPLRDLIKAEQERNQNITGVLAQLQTVVADPQNGLWTQVARQGGVLAALTAAQAGTVDQATLEQAAERGAKEALAGLTLIAQK